MDWLAFDKERIKMGRYIFTRKTVGFILIGVGYTLSYLLYTFLFKAQHIYGFFHSDSFFIIGMPIMFFGALLVLPFIKKENLAIGFFAKALFCIIVIIWFAMVIGMVIGNLR